MQKAVAIDGPSGAGKSSLAKQLARDLNLLYVDTGAMFRGLALYFYRQQVQMDDDHSLGLYLPLISFVYGKSEDELIVIQGENFTQDIRQHFVSDLASRISKVPSVRKFLLQKQRDLAQSQYCVMEGRDIGTVVFPRAFCKIFLTADPEVRAKRRFIELQAKGSSTTYQQVLDDVTERDKRDSEREIAPLKQASDALLLDTSALTQAQAQAELKAKVLQRVQQLGLNDFPTFEEKPVL